VVQGEFKWRQFTAEVILWAVRWYLMFSINYRDLELMLLDRGMTVDQTTIFRWIQVYAVELEKRIRPHLRRSNGSWRARKMKKDTELWCRSRLRQVKYLNNIVEQGHRHVKWLTGPGLGFTARRTLAGFGAMAMISKGQIRHIGGNDES
jgi:transposase-like protein